MNHADLLLPMRLGESALSAESMTSPLDTIARWFGETFLPVVDLSAAEGGKKTTKKKTMG